MAMTQVCTQRSALTNAGALCHNAERHGIKISSHLPHILLPSFSMQGLATVWGSQILSTSGIVTTL